MRVNSKPIDPKVALDICNRIRCVLAEGLINFTALFSIYRMEIKKDH